jgi:hypothetical protein
MELLAAFYIFVNIFYSLYKLRERKIDIKMHDLCHMSSSIVSVR